ncbi:hypothetical protein T05_12550 [Trichinella murrelli]|uniref:Uncharacterized protein n=1 Tax=Trichinella murrelli TaxID=144512 RepID=A0A0V0T4M8_9BILA|nr:hypothetical protein T05_12550 [Trichinella murrelli]
MSRMNRAPDGATHVRIGCQDFEIAGPVLHISSDYFPSQFG